jgi:hypothetical protein
MGGLTPHSKIIQRQSTIGLIPFEETDQSSVGSISDQVASWELASAAVCIVPVKEHCPVEFQLK